MLMYMYTQELKEESRSDDVALLMVGSDLHGRTCARIESVAGCEPGMTLRSFVLNTVATLRFHRRDDQQYSKSNYSDSYLVESRMARSMRITVLHTGACPCSPNL